MSSLQENPFFVKTPETMTAQEVVDLFVPFSDYLSIQDPGHIFIHGHRGCGKSMVFRYLSPDCQALLHKKEISELPYYGVYLSVKATDLNIGELTRLQNQISGHILSEHFLVIYLAVKTLQSLGSDLASTIDRSNSVGELLQFCEEVVLGRLRMAGWIGDPRFSENDSASTLLSKAVEALDTIHAQSFQYVKRLMTNKESVPFTGVLLGFQDLLLPLIRALGKLSFTPAGPVYLFIDDADNLSLQQTQVLNTWVSYRTNEYLSLKIATQLGYKTYSTVNAGRIEAAHDYSAVIISNIYTGRSRDNYPKWVEDVVNRRLQIAGLTTDAKQFFPDDKQQADEIRAIAEKIKRDWKPGQSGYRAGDDAYRFARPEYITRLGGNKKQSHTYKYCGFDQLVHISSGIIRYFLDPSSKMYSLAKEESEGQKIDSIPPSIQDRILRSEADELMHREFEKLLDEIQNDEQNYPSGTPLNLEKLRNLITVLGSLFYQYLIDPNRSERRYFSFFISSEPTKEVLSVIKLGIRFGYFYESYVGTREGRGRTPLYVMTRRLAPYFKLDPMGFAAHKSLTNDFLAQAIDNPKSILYRLKKDGNLDALVSGDDGQQQLFT